MFPATSDFAVQRRRGGPESPLSSGYADCFASAPPGSPVPDRPGCAAWSARRRRRNGSCSLVDVPLIDPRSHARGSPAGGPMSRWALSIRLFTARERESATTPRLSRASAGPPHRQAVRRACAGSRPTRPHHGRAQHRENDAPGPGGQPRPLCAEDRAFGRSLRDCAV